MNAIEQRYIEGRELGELGLSIATDLAISRALGRHPEIVDKAPPLDKYDAVMLNLRTAVRNFLGSIDGQVRKHVTPKAATTYMLNELAAVAESVGSKRFGIYYSSYDGLKKTFPRATVRELKTVIQIANAKQEQDICIQVISRLKESGFIVPQYDVYIKPKDSVYPKIMLMTHLPVDLLSSDKFKEVVLLESHTGAIKNKLEWNTKLTRGKELENIPFNHFTLQLFGDNNNLFSGKDIKLRTAVIEAAKRHRWTTGTSLDRVKHSVSNIPNMGYRTELSGLF